MTNMQEMLGSMGETLKKWIARVIGYVVDW